jgi:cytidylate kinase
MVVTIDGPSAAGKSSVAKLLAKRLGFHFLDTGAMYRAVALAALRENVDPDAEQQLEQLVAKLDIRQEGERTLLNGEDVSREIRRVEVSDYSSRVAKSRAVRERMVQLQRMAAKGRNIVTEGRDQGTVVFPNAACKVFLTASSQVRARRRQRELAERGVHKSIEQILAEQTERDKRDASRDIAPLTPAPDAVIIDSTDMSLEQAVDEVERHVRARLADLETAGSGA